MREKLGCANRHEKGSREAIGTFMKKNRNKEVRRALREVEKARTGRPWWERTKDV